MVQDAEPIRRTFLAIKDQLQPNLLKALAQVANIKDHAPKVKKARRNLMDCDALLAKKSSNKQEAKPLVELIDDMKKSSAKIVPELEQLKAKHLELEQELLRVNAAIGHHESNLAKLPDVIRQRKQEMSVKVKEGKSIRKDLENIPGTAEEDEQALADVDSIRLNAVKIIRDTLGL